MRPEVNMKTKVIKGTNPTFISFNNEEIGRGSRIAISKSNNKKSRATRKKRKEKGNREDLIGSNPHS